MKNLRMEMLICRLVRNQESLKIDESSLVKIWFLERPQGNALSADVNTTVVLECNPGEPHQSSSFQCQVSAMMTRCQNLISLKS